MAALRWRAPARVSVAGPAGWAPSETVVVHHSDGDALVSVESWPVAADADLAAVATEHADGARPGTGWQDDAWTTASVLGVAEGRRRRSRRVDDAGVAQLEVSQAYALLGGRLFALTEMVPSRDEVKAAEAAEVAAAVTVAHPTVDDHDPRSLRDGPPDFATAAAGWVTGSSVAPAAEHLLTTEECFAIARHHGVLMLPGGDTTRWDSLDEGRRELAAEVAWHSLEARGVRTDPGLREVASIAASHDLLVVVDAEDAQGVRTWWYAARADRAVALTAGETPGQVRAAVHDTAALADQVLSTTRDAVRVRTSCLHRRAGGAVVGHETAWTSDTPPEQRRAGLVGLLPAVTPAG